MSLSAVGLTGCFDAPPEYSVPERLPPILDDAQAQPPLSSLVVVSRSIPIDLRIPFQVDPNEGRLQAYFVVDINSSPPERNILCQKRVPTGARSVFCDGDWVDYPSAGCHTVTLFISYENNVGEAAPFFADPTLVSQATWFTSFGVESLCFQSPAGEVP